MEDSLNNYPEHLSPEFNEDGSINTPFEVWWPRVKSFFFNVPEEIAKEWLYRHWRYSPFSWIPSQLYNFSIEAYPTSSLVKIRNRVYDFDENNVETTEHGKYLCGDHPDRKWRIEPLWLVDYIKENGIFPSPIVILDNRDNHLSSIADLPNFVEDHPQALILAEGHKRHEIGLYLHSIGKMKPSISICRLSINYDFTRN